MLIEVALLGAAFGVVPGAVGGGIMDLIESAPGMESKRVLFAMVLGATIGFCYTTLLGIPLLGFLPGAAGGFIAVMWRVNWSPTGWEEFFPLRRQWLRIFLTMLLFALVPLALRAIPIWYTRPH